MRTRLTLACSAALALTGSAAGQVVVPTPKKPEPAPEWQPPNKPAAPTTRAAPDAPAAPGKAPTKEILPNIDDNPPEVSIVQRDGDTVLWLTDPADEVAALKVAEAASLERRAKIHAALALRKAQVHAVLARNADAAMQTRATMRALGDAPTDAQLDEAAKAFDDLVMRESIVIMLKSRDAITPKQEVAIKRAAVEYRRELNKQGMAKHPPNAPDGMKLVARTNAVRSNTVEALRELDGLLVRVADRWSGLRGALNMTKAQEESIAAAEAKVSEAKSPAQKADAAATVLNLLSGQQRKVAFTAVVDPLPEGEKAVAKNGK